MRAVSRTVCVQGCHALVVLRGCHALVVLRGCRALVVLRGCHALVVLRGCRALFELRGCRALFELRGCHALFVLRGCHALFVLNALHHSDLFSTLVIFRDRSIPGLDDILDAKLSEVQDHMRTLMQKQVREHLYLDVLCFDSVGKLLAT